MVCAGNKIISMSLNNNNDEIDGSNNSHHSDVAMTKMIPPTTATTATATDAAIHSVEMTMSNSLDGIEVDFHRASGKAADAAPATRESCCVMSISSNGDLVSNSTDQQQHQQQQQQTEDSHPIQQDEDNEMESSPVQRQHKEGEELKESIEVTDNNQMDAIAPPEEQQSNAGAPCATSNVESHPAAATTASTTDPTVVSPCLAAEKCVSSCAAYGHICPAHARIAAQYATTALINLTHNSRLFADTTDTAAVPTNTKFAAGNSKKSKSSQDGPIFPFVSPSDLLMGKKLGEGGFSEVYSCTFRNLEPGQLTKEYAVKYLKRKAMVDLHHFKHGAADIAMEAYFLQALRHKHIVQVHGVVVACVSAAASTTTTTADNNSSNSSNNNKSPNHSLLSVTASIEQCALAANNNTPAPTNSISSSCHHNNHNHIQDAGFGLLIDRLYDTLEHRIDVWRLEREEQAKQLQFLQRFVLHSEYKQKRRAEVLERCAIALQIADALEYLHSKRIVYRDLKPDNIGFDRSGVLKLFDFGLAKELKDTDALPCGRYELTGNTGSRRYMAPEVARAQPYDESVDVYSFGILLWELLTTQKPFYGYSANRHMQLVVMGKERPPLDSSAHVMTCYWPSVITWLVQRCWSNTPAQRPSFTVIRAILKDVLNGIDKIPTEKELSAIMFPPASTTTTTEHSQQPKDGENHSQQQQQQQHGAVRGSEGGENSAETSSASCDNHHHHHHHHSNRLSQQASHYFSLLALFRSGPPKPHNKRSKSNESSAAGSVESSSSSNTSSSQHHHHHRHHHHHHHHHHHRHHHDSNPHTQSCIVNPTTAATTTPDGNGEMPLEHNKPNSLLPPILAPSKSAPLTLKDITPAESCGRRKSWGLRR